MNITINLFGLVLIFGAAVFVYQVVVPIVQYVH